MGFHEHLDRSFSLGGGGGDGGGCFHFSCYLLLASLMVLKANHQTLSLWGCLYMGDWSCAFRAGRTITVPTIYSCTKCVRRPGMIHDCTLDSHQVPWTWMISSQLNVALIRKLRGSLMYLAYLFDMLNIGVCTTRH